MRTPCNGHDVDDGEDFEGMEDYDPTTPEIFDDEEDSFDLTWYEETEDEDPEGD